MNPQSIALEPRPAHGNLSSGASVGGAAPSRRTPSGDALTERAHRIWSAGSYDRIAAGFLHEGEAFVERLSLREVRDDVDEDERELLVMAATNSIEPSACGS